MNNTVTAAEQETHILDLERLWRAAYQRFEAFGDPADRDAAVLWLHEQNQAILNRSDGVLARRHAAFERRLDEGADYFQVQGRADRSSMLERRAA